MIPNDISLDAERLLETCRRAGLRLATVESCTGGLVAGALTGIAGPGGGSDVKPVGLVHIAAYRDGGETLHERNVFPGDRNEVRLASVRKALAMMQRLAEQ